VQKYGRSGQVTDDNITPGMSFVCFDATNARSDNNNNNYYYYIYYNWVFTR